MTQSAQETMLTPEELALQLKVCVATIRRLCQRGSLPAVKVGRQWRVPESALEAYLNRKNQKADKQSDQGRN